MLLYAEDLGGARVHVQAPSDVVFLCGGRCSPIGDPTPLSLRDAFLKILDNPALEGRHLIQAEDISAFEIFRDYYQDLLQFETDLAQIAELILLFCESEGSLAELGAFSMVAEIARRLLVVIRDSHWEEDSFVKLGPLRALERVHGSTSVFVLVDSEIRMQRRSSSASQVDKNILRDRLQEPIKLRLDSAREPTTFDPQRAGHVIKLIVGLIQEYGALTIDEIKNVLLEFKIEKDQQAIGAYLLCAEFVDWIVKKRIGMATYYFAKNLPDAATFALKDDAIERNKLRRRTRIRQHWKDNDPVRDHGIREIFGATSP